MKKRMKRITALALAAMMTFSLAACGSNGKDADDAGKSKDGKTTIKITWWGGQSRHDYTQKLLDAYEESHPDIEFEALPAGWDGYFEKLSTQAASGSMPDIVQMDSCISLHMQRMIRLPTYSRILTMERSMYRR